MVETKKLTFWEVLSQAKTLEQRIDELSHRKPHEFPTDYRNRTDELRHEKLVSVVGLQRIFFSERTFIKKLGKLLENRPKIEKWEIQSKDYPEIINTTMKIPSVDDYERWFVVFVREFEGMKKIVGDEEK